METSAMLFPGQGAQYVGMGKWLYESYSKVKEIYIEASDYLQYDVIKLCFEGSKEKLDRTEYTQPALLVTEFATAKILIDELGYIPQFLAGHSLGEYAALALAGGITFREAILLVQLRGKLMQESVVNGMGAMSAIIGLEPYTVNTICEDMNNSDYIVEISNYNSPVQTVISGHKRAVDEAGKLCEALNARVVPLSVSAPFHCKLMKSAAEQFKDALNNIKFYPLEYPVISNVTGIPYVNEKMIKELLVAQMVRPVEWSKSMKFLQLCGVKTFIDIGPTDTLKNFTFANCPNNETLSLDQGKKVLDIITSRIEFY